MKKIILYCLIVCFLFSNVKANEIDKYIKQSKFEVKSTVAIYVEDKNSNKIIYKKDEEKLLNPASTLKTLTFGASYLILGSNYKFETAVYLDNYNNLYVKLGADSLLTQNDLYSLFKQVKESFDTTKIQNIYIDDFIIEKNVYPTSWMTEDIWPNQKLITPYIVDKNSTQIAIKRSSLNSIIDIIQNDDYKLAIINDLKSGEEQKFNIEKMYGVNSNIINLKGTIKEDEIFDLPVLNPEINFQIKLIKAINKNDIKFDKKITVKKTPVNARKIACVSHDIKEISKDILLNSDNIVAETVFKVAAAKYINYSHPATLQDGLNMFKCVYENELNLNEGINISDASGVSRYNLISAKFLADCLKKLFLNSDIRSLMATANQGTLKDRLLFLENNIRAKTGTLAQMSAISGIFTSKKNKDIIFSIIIQNSPKRKALLKNFENTLIGILYRKY